MLHHERIDDLVFRRAVELLDEGAVDELGAYLTQHQHIVSQRIEFEGGGYFSNPTLLEFVAENPVRHARLPANIVDVARVILEAGGKTDSLSINSALGLVASGRVVRECGFQEALIHLFCDYGANPKDAMTAALGHGEFGAVEALMQRGVPVSLSIAAATNRTDDVKALLPNATEDSMHRAIALSTQFGHLDVVTMLLDAGVDPSRYNPPGIDAHSTPLHQAVLAGHFAVVKLLVDRKARLDIEDTLFNGTPLDWSIHAGHEDIAQYLRDQVAQ